MKPYLCSLVILLAGCASPSLPVPQAPAEMPVDKPVATANTPQAPAEVLLDKVFFAYNNHDIDTLVGYLASDVRSYKYPNELKETGRDNARQGYVELFAKVPKIHAVMTSRFTRGNFVIADVIVTGFPDGSERRFVEITEVRDQLVAAVWTIR